MSSEFEMAARLGGFEWLESRGDSMASKPKDFLTQAATGSNGNMTNQMIFNQFKFAAAKSVRTSTIILASFNAVAAFATALGILYDAYSREKRNNRSYRFTYVQTSDGGSWRSVVEPRSRLLTLLLSP